MVQKVKPGKLMKKKTFISGSKDKKSTKEKVPKRKIEKFAILSWIEIKTNQYFE